MPTSFPFSEAKVKALSPPPTGRIYHKDSKYPGLQLCITATGTKTYYLVKRIGGRPTRVRLGTVQELSVETVRNTAAKIAGDVAGGGDPQGERRKKREETTLGELWEHWYLYAQAHKKPSSIKEDILKYNKFMKSLEHRRLSTIKKSDVAALHARVGRENGPYQANRLLALLRSMLNKADETGYRGENPAKGIKMFKEQSRDRFLHPDELKQFFSALKTEGDLIRDFYLTLLLTGARRSNVQTMRWENVDLQAGYWQIPETKAGIPVIVPIVAPLAAILTAHREIANGCDWVFPGRKGGHIANPKGAWGRIVKRSGLTDLRPHDLRRSLGSWMAGQNVSLQIIGKALGHKTAQATMVYSRLSLDPVRDAVDNATSAMLTAGGVSLLEDARDEGQKAGEI